METRQSSLPRVAFVAAWVVLAGGYACSRTEDPREHYGTSARAGAGPSQSGGSLGSGAQPSQPAGSSNVGSNAATGGSHGNGAEPSGGAPEGGAPPALIEVPTELGCGEPPVSTEPFTQLALRAAAADCAQYHYCRFESGARILQDQIAGYVDAPDERTLTAARTAFAQANSLWSVAELFQFGPAGSSAVSAGKDIYRGEGLRELIYSWPLTVRCRVEEEVALQDYLEDMSSVPVSARGLFGLEYLLYYPGADTACVPSSSTAKAWAKLDSSELAARKLEYAAALASDVVLQAGTLRTAWSPDGDDFRSDFINLVGYPTDEHKTMTVMAWSLIYVEREVKDWKLGVPAGYTLSSPVILPESTYSGLGTENLRANLRGFRALFQGCGEGGEGLGFDDWLIEQNNGALAADIITAWQNAQSAADSYPRFSDASPHELETLYRAVKALTDLVKSDLFGDGSTLNLDLPEGVASDTD